MIFEIPVEIQNFYVIGLGLIVGSFVNVLIYRMPAEQSVVKPGSHCMACQAPLKAWQNIPVISYLLLKGRCANCGIQISPRYVLIEILTAVLFFAAKQRFGWGWLLFLRDFPWLALMVAITFIDLDHRIIPDKLNIAGLVIGLATAAWEPRLGLYQAVLGGAVGFGVFYLMASLYHRIAGREGLGGGDIKLLGMLGVFVGAQGVFITILLSSILGTLVGVVYGLLSRQKRVMDVAIPYGPFLVVGALIYYAVDPLVWVRWMGGF